MSIDINRLSAKELESLISQAKKRKSTLSKRKPLATVRKRLTQLAKAEGYTIEELFGGASAPAARAPRAAKAPAKARKAQAKVAPKYRNPDNSSETWTGRGKQPRWLAAMTAQGRELAEFVIK